MTDLAPAATETVAPAIPAPRGSAGSAWLKWLARRIGLALHLDQPVIVRYFAWLGGLLTGNLGTSIANGLPVGELVGPRIVNSAVLVLSAAIVMIPLAFGIAM